MSQHYSNPAREHDPHALPDIEVYQLTSEEAATLDEDAVYEASKLFPLAHMNSRERDKLIAHLIEENGRQGGWYWHACFPGCLPDSVPFGPFPTYAEALADAQENASEE